MKEKCFLQEKPTKLVNMYIIKTDSNRIHGSAHRGDSKKKKKKKAELKLCFQTDQRYL